MAQITILGCGSSSGVPIIGCDCAVCTSSSPKNKRLRSSVLIQADGLVVLVDTSPDLRQQALSNHIRHIDAIIFTHAHSDHICGLDDVRAFNYLSNKMLPVYSDKATLTEIRQRFSHAFSQSPTPRPWMKPSLMPYEIIPYVPFSVQNTSFLPFSQIHGKGTSLGIRMNDFAYTTDANGLTEEAIEALRGIKTWVVDCLRYEEAPTHAHLDLVMQWVERIKPERVVLTHMSHGLEYEELRKLLPPHIEPAYDGMTISV